MLKSYKKHYTKSYITLKQILCKTALVLLCAYLKLVGIQHFKCCVWVSVLYG